ncbi:MAG: hypothetical protein M1832_004368 [Thelocarpon impressellum]|nr:MAG: hypothetical protein M1832_004368 [Thelocarpon impressellum]
MSSSLRQRAPLARPSPPSSAPSSPPSPAPSSSKDAGTSTPASLLDVLRLLAGLLLLNGLLSYFVTNDSFTWGYRPRLTRLGPLRAWLNGPLLLSPEELAQYNGSAPDLPIYLAVNGTAYDVSAGRETYYGPGGSYAFFAGRDGARAFVTGCFAAEHVVPDLAGAEDVFLPQQPGAVSREDRRAALEQVRKSVQNWQSFFRKSEKYFEVGRVVYPPDWKDRGEEVGLCEQASRARPRMPGT